MPLAPLNKFKNSVIFLKQIWENFSNDRCKLYAASLTFITSLTLIPFLAFLLAISKGLGIQEFIQPLLIKKLALGKQEIFLKILEYIQNTNLKTLGTGGILFLLLAVMRLLGSIEEVFNIIWKVKTPRRITRKISDYFTIVILCPLFIFLAISITASLSSEAIVQKFLKFSLIGGFYLYFIKLLPFLTVWLAFCIFYMFMPNTKVNLSAGILSGIVCGTIWQIFYWTYLKFQIGVTKYNAIYGTFASLPIFLIWIYFSWSLILLGAELSFTFQNRKKLHLIPKGKVSALFGIQELLEILRRIVTEFQEGRFPLREEKLLQNQNLDPLKVDGVLKLLLETKILVQKEEEFYFTKNPSQILLKEVISPRTFLSQEERLTQILKNIINQDVLESYSLVDLL